MKIKHLLLVALAITALAPSAEAQFTYLVNGDGTCTIEGYDGSGGAVTIPGAINGLVVTSIGFESFYDQPLVTSVVISDTVTNIDSYAFSYCTGLTNVAIIPNSVASIGSDAFAGCTSLTSIYFQGNPPSLGSSVFLGDSSLTVYYLTGTTGWGSSFGGVPTSLFPFNYSDNGDGTCTIYGYGYTGYTGAMTIPNSIYGLTVVSIAQYGFQGFGMTSVTIPNSVTNIESDAFESCASLTSVTIPNSVTSLGNEVFRDCTQLAGITIPNGVTGIGDSEFYNCTSLASVAIPNSVIGISSWAFYNCAHLTSVTIPNSVTGFGDFVFTGCAGLASVTLSDSMTRIGIAAFDGCASLTKVTIPNSVTSIGNSAFADCTHLTSVTIPNSVSSIGDYVFSDCTLLTSVTIPKSITSLGDYAFNYCSRLTSIYFQGNAPAADSTVFSGDPHATVYYALGAAGWGPTFADVPAVLWNPQGTSFSATGGHFGFNIAGPTNAIIVVEACTNLANPIWLPVSTNILSGSGASAFSDSQSGEYPHRFYRFRSP